MLQGNEFIHNNSANITENLKNFAIFSSATLHRKWYLKSCLNSLMAAIWTSFMDVLKTLSQHLPTKMGNLKCNFPIP